ncbi:hypothetical protein [uncultured Ruegeria sp.]|uniref:hypothetical protein n=1 Tax=uncultured Ruegeria sp. TaxID=259304 RepID=UPI00260E505E|nr:hypothetical protein [uncultured Ruegeria sp.]
MTFKEALDHGLQSAVTWIVVGLLGGIYWLVRRVFTNQKQIESLQKSLEHRDDQRARDMNEFRSSFKRLEDSQKELREDVKNLFQRRSP